MDSSIEKTLKRISELRAVQIYENKRTLFFYNFFIGMAHGLGALFGATVVIALLVLVLSQFSWVPIVGDFIVEVVRYLRTVAPTF